MQQRMVSFELVSLLVLQDAPKQDYYNANKNNKIAQVQDSISQVKDVMIKNIGMRSFIKLAW